MKLIIVTLLLAVMGFMMKLAQSMLIVLSKTSVGFRLSLRHAPFFTAPIWIETGDISGYPPVNVCVSHWGIDPREIPSNV